MPNKPSPNAVAPYGFPNSGQNMPPQGSYYGSQGPQSYQPSGYSSSMPPPPPPGYPVGSGNPMPPQAGGGPSFNVQPPSGWPYGNQQNTFSYYSNGYM